MSNTTYAIYPAIGVARVGNAPEEFYIGPETYGGLPILADGRSFGRNDFRDAEGRIRRQAARFRVYRSVDGGAPEEVTLDTPGVTAIRWAVHVANKKSSWYEFSTKQGETGYPPNHPLRNPSKTTPDERRRLIIDPGPRTIAGKSQGAVPFSRDTIPSGYKGGVFPPPTLKPHSIDTLGELRTDNQGRLLVLGGLGRSGSEEESPVIKQYANNDGWWDDTSDGPVEAVVVITDADGKSVEIPVTPAWVICGPPSYAPQIANVVTLYDTIFDMAVRHMAARPDIFEDGLWKAGPDGYKPYFETDIRPIFERAGNNTWVAAMPSRPHAFDLKRLSDPSQELIGMRQYYLSYLRGPGQENVLLHPDNGATLMPYLAGDDALRASEPGTTTAATSKFLRITDTQYFFMMQWAAGHFHPGKEPSTHPGEALTRAVLENCVGGAFSPGIEMSWNSRNPAMYSAPFRIRPRKPVPGPLNLGYNPAAGMEPGDICRYMAVPWQADFNECSSQPIVGRVLWWWPAQRPEYVFLEPKGLRATPGPEHGTQVPWIGTAYDQNASGYINFIDDLEMVEKWDKLGFIYNIGTEEEVHFVEVSRLLPRNTPDEG
jgi:hypothetical protein